MQRRIIKNPFDLPWVAADSLRLVWFIPGAVVTGDEEGWYFRRREKVCSARTQEPFAIKQV